MPPATIVDPRKGIMIVEETRAEQLCLRLFGSIAVWHHCPTLRTRIEQKRPHPFQDFDFAAPYHDKRQIEQFFRRRAWILDDDVASVPGARCTVLYKIRGGIVIARCDIHYDFLYFCHFIDCRTRLHIDEVTIPLAELVLSKLQPNQLGDSDLFDLAMLLLEHDVSNGDTDTINAKVIKRSCAADWGLFTTVRLNITKAMANVADADWLSVDERALVMDRLDRLCKLTLEAPKPCRWRARNIIGKRLRWYDEVDPVGLRVGDEMDPRHLGVGAYLGS